MTVLSIVTAWLAMTAAGFAGLSAFARAGAREEDIEADRTDLPRGMA